MRLRPSLVVKANVSDIDFNRLIPDLYDIEPRASEYTVLL